MQSMLAELGGRKCIVKTEDEEYLSGSPDVPCRVTGTDGEWIKVSFVDPVGGRMSRLLRVDYLTDITVFEE